MSSKKKPEALCPILFVVLPGSAFFDIAGAMEAFSAANAILEELDLPPLYHLELASTAREALTRAGFTVQTSRLQDARPPHSLVIGDAPDLIAGDAPKSLLTELGRLASGAVRVAATGAGAFALGQLGLLDGRSCTTHWRVREALAERFPKARVQADALHVEDEDLHTTAGKSAGLDLALAFIEKDLDSSLALAVARSLLVGLRRVGGQSQFGPASSFPSELDPPLRGLLDRIAERPREDYSVEKLAEEMEMSPRHFARVFRDRTGQTPAAAVRALRLDAAREALEEDGKQSLSDIAQACGFGSESTLRRVFEQSLGLNPAEYRRRFRRS